MNELEKLLKNLTDSQRKAVGAAIPQIKTELLSLDEAQIQKMLYDAGEQNKQKLLFVLKDIK